MVGLVAYVKIKHLQPASLILLNLNERQCIIQTSYRIIVRQNIVIFVHVVLECPIPELYRSGNNGICEILLLYLKVAADECREEISYLTHIKKGQIAPPAMEVIIFGLTAQVLTTGVLSVPS